jgi:hypothetical protein
MIVVEGPDGAGKTTLIEVLVDLLQLPVADRVVGKDTQAMVNLKAWTEANVDKGFQKVIYDRHRLISEPIYGPILRDEPQDGFVNLVWMTEMMRKFYAAKPVLIYCLPPIETVFDNVFYDVENDNSAVEGRIARIYSAYVARAAIDKANHFNTLTYDYTQQPPDLVADRVRSYLRARNFHE